MVVCTFYQQGRCKFGDRCKYEHPGSQSQSAFGTGNRFGALQSGKGFGGGGGSLASRVTGQGGGQDAREKYGLNATDIQHDLTAGKGRPLWIFSAYGPGKNPPTQLFGGPEREQSFEEMRALHYAAAASGNEQQAIQDANNLYSATESQINTILNDLDGAIKYIIDSENQHPNRQDIVLGNATGAPAPELAGQATASSPFGQPGGQTQGPSFSQPSPLGQPPQTAAATPAFGQPSSLGKPTFGQASVPGQQLAPVQPSMMGRQQPAFGQPSALGSSPFTQAMGQTATQPSPFGGTQGASPFGQMGTQTQQASPFAQPQQQSQSQDQKQSPFGQMGQSAQSNPFNQAQQGQAASPFGQTGTSAAQSSGFPAATSTPFGQPSTLGPAAPAPPSQPQPQAPQTQTTAPTVPHRDPTSLNPFPNISGETRRDPMNKKLVSWKGRPVKYIDEGPCYQHPDDAETYVHIHFPDGPPGPENFKEAAGIPEDYTAEIEAAYRYVKEHGSFKDGIMPAVPPKPEWCSFDF